MKIEVNNLAIDVVKSVGSDLTLTRNSLLTERSSSAKYRQPQNTVNLKRSTQQVVEDTQKTIIVFFAKADRKLDRVIST